MPHETGGRESILETSAKLFCQKGYKGVSIRDIAQACGMTNAALYYHFENKEDLFLAMLQHNHTQTMSALLEAASAEGDLRDRLKRLVTRYADVMRSQRQSFWTVRRDVHHIDDARASKLFGGMRADFMRPIQQLIEAGQVQHQIIGGDAAVYARLLSGMIIALTFEGKPGGRQTRVTSEEVDTLVNVFLEGIGLKHTA